jgi:hypothetical protein
VVTNPKRIEVASWANFEELLTGYYKRPLHERSRYLFRGQGQVDWPLETSLDRYLSAHSIDPSKRNAVSERLHAEFLSQCSDLLGKDRTPTNPTEASILARHHGVPNQILDWTMSPYIAAFFAASTGTRRSDFSIWLFDRHLYFDNPDGDDPIVLIDSPEYSRFNTRAVEQYAVAMEVNEATLTSSDRLSKCLWRFDASASLRRTFLDRLASMRITSRTLFDPPIMPPRPRSGVWQRSFRHDARPKSVRQPRPQAVR